MEASLRAWRTAFRERPFTRAEATRFRKLPLALRRRKAARRRELERRLIREALATTLELLPEPAWLVCESRGVVLANAPGRKLAKRGLGPVVGRRQKAPALPAGYQRLAPPPRCLDDSSPRLWLVVGPRLHGSLRRRLRHARHEWGLTDREVEVLEALCHGSSNRDIARRIACAPRTVEHHVSSLLAKAGARSRAIVVARLLG